MIEFVWLSLVRMEDEGDGKTVCIPAHKILSVTEVDADKTLVTIDGGRYALIAGDIQDVMRRIEAAAACYNGSQ